MAARIVPSVCTLVAAHRAISPGSRPAARAAAAIFSSTALTFWDRSIISLLSLQKSNRFLGTPFSLALHQHSVLKVGAVDDNRVPRPEELFFRARRADHVVARPLTRAYTPILLTVAGGAPEEALGSCTVNSSRRRASLGMRRPEKLSKISSAVWWRRRVVRVR